MSHPEDKYFDKYEKRGPYHWKWYRKNTFGYRDKVDFLVQQFPSKGTILDAGGGDGLISYKLFQHGLNVTCLDYNPVSIEQARAQFVKRIYGTFPLSILRKLFRYNAKLIERFENNGANFISASYEDIDFEEPFDYVVCHEVIEHVKEPKKLLAFIYANIKRFAIISTPDVTNKKQHPLDYHSWTPETFSDLLRDYKFEFIVNDGDSMYVKLFK